MQKKTEKVKGKEKETENNERSAFPPASFQGIDLPRQRFHIGIKITFLYQTLNKNHNIFFHFEFLAPFILEKNTPQKLKFLDKLKELLTNNSDTSVDTISEEFSRFLKQDDWKDYADVFNQLAALINSDSEYNYQRTCPK